MIVLRLTEKEVELLLGWGYSVDGEWTGTEADWDMINKLKEVLDGKESPQRISA